MKQADGTKVAKYDEYQTPLWKKEIIEITP